MEDNFPRSVYVYSVAALQDPVVNIKNAQLQQKLFSKLVGDRSVLKKIKGDHWVAWNHPNRVNRILSQIFKRINES